MLKPVVFCLWPVAHTTDGLCPVMKVPHSLVSDGQKIQYVLTVSKESEVALCLEDVHMMNKDGEAEQEEPLNLVEVRW